jgi:uncharacterized protein (DUF488 family)
VRKQIFTVGHSNQSPDQFLKLLAQHGIEMLVDVRRFPSSRKFPHFNQSNLNAALQKAGIEYVWLEALGGRRHEGAGEESSNNGLHNAGFRNYADYMLTAEFRKAIDELLQTASRKRTAIMCAEALFWRCHRRLISDFLVVNALRVEHIMPSGELQLHKLTTGALADTGGVTYPGQNHLFS